MNTISLKSRITQKRRITGTVNDSNSISGTAHQLHQISGTIKNPSHVHGTIAKPSPHGKSDHVFVTVDLLKLYSANMQMQTSQLKISLPATNLSLDNATVTEI